MNFQQHLDHLVKLSSEDLSAAHVLQHTYSADLIRNQYQLNVTGPGSYSVYKPTDQIECDRGYLTGQKHWVSYLPQVTWAILTVKSNQNEKVVLIHLDSSTKIQMIPTVGMENTFTGHLNLDRTPYQELCDVNHNDYFAIRRQQTLGFIAIHYGLARALFEDLDNYTNRCNTECGYHKQKLKLQLDVMQLIWEQIPKIITLDHQDQYFWKQKNTAYSFAKKCLLDICQFVTEITGSGIYITEHPFHQRYKDALIYSTHMKNLYLSLQA